MSFNKKMRTLLSVFLVAGVFLAGCSSDDSQQQSSTQPSQQPQAQQQGPQQGQQGQQKPQLNKQESIDPSSISDEDLEQFAKAMDAARKVQSEAQADMKKIVEDEGMTFKRFRQLMMSKKSKKLQQKMNITDEEKSKMKSLQPKMQKAQQEAQQEIMKTIKESGISMERFKEISRALRQNKELMKRFKEIQSDNSMGGGQDNQ